MDGNTITLGKRVEDELPEPPDPWDSPRVAARKQARQRGRKGDRVTLTREQLKKGHTHVRGRTGSGKTQLILLPLALQLMHSYDLMYKLATGEKKCIRENDCLCIFDNGGDPAMFNKVRTEADRLGRTFRYVSLESDKSFGFDPFQIVPNCDARIIRLVVFLLEALNMDNGTVSFGGAYYTQRNAAQLLAVADKAFEEKALGRNVTVADIDRYIQQKQNQIKDAEQVRMVFRFLAQYELLQPQSKDSEAIDFKRAIRDREVIYFFTPTLGEATTARLIAGLGLYTAVNAAIELSESRTGEELQRPIPHIHLLVDEVQELVGSGLASIMAQARKHGCSMVCANQSTQQLMSRDQSLADIIRDNTTTKIYFTCTGKADTDELQSYSKQARATLTTTQQASPMIANAGRGGGGESYSEYVTPLLTVNNIIETTATSREFYLIDQSGGGHKEPVRTRADYVLSEPEYIRHLNTPLQPVKRPTRGKRRRVDTPALAPWQLQHKSAPDKERVELLKKLYRKVAELSDEQRWS